MNQSKKFSIKARFKSFYFAFQGLKVFFRTQHNSWIHAVAALVVIFLGFILNVDITEWCWLVTVISMVFITELLNTAIEFLCDFVSPEIHPQIKRIKDISAAAVLIAAIAAVVVGVIVFLPKIVA
jgi:diacylglycerol kinase